MKTYITTITITARNGKRETAVNRVTAVSADAACDAARIAARCSHPGFNISNAVARLATVAELAV